MQLSPILKRSIEGKAQQKSILIVWERGRRQVLQVAGHTAVQARQRQTEKSYSGGMYRLSHPLPALIITYQHDHVDKSSAWKDKMAAIQINRRETS